MANKYAPRTSSVKQPQKVKNENGYGLLWTFLIGFAVFFLLGSLLREKVEVMDFGRGKFLLNFFYARVSDIFSRALGMPIASGMGRMVTLAASIFYLTMAVLLYNIPCACSTTDFDDAPYSILSRGIHFVCAYAYLSRLSYLVLDGITFYGMVDQGRRSSRTALIMFAIYLIVALHGMADAFDDSDKRTHVFRLFSSFGFMLGITGLCRVIWDFDLAKVVILPSRFNTLFLSIAQKADPTVSSAIGLVLILLLVACAIGLFGYLLGKNALALAFSIVGSTLLIYGGYVHYARFGEMGVEIRALSHWILLFAMAFTWCSALECKRIPMLLGATGLFCSLSTIFYAFKAFYEPFCASLDALDVKVIPKQEQALAFVTRFIEDDVVSGIVIFLILIVVLVVALLLLGKIGKGKSCMPPNVLAVGAMLLIAGSVLRFMHAQEAAQFFVRPVSYVAITVGIVILLGALIYALVRRNMAAMAQCIYMYIITAAATYVCCLFAFQVGMIMISILLCLNLIGMGVAFAKSGKDFAQAAVDKELIDTLDVIEGAVGAGDMGFAQGAYAASVAFDLHAAATDAISSWDD